MEPLKEKTLLDWFGHLRDGWKALCIAVAVGLILAFIVTLRQPTQYGATGTVLVSPAEGFLDPSAADTLPALTDTVARLATTPVVLQNTASRFVAAAPTFEIGAQRRNLATLAWLRAHLSARQVGTSSILDLSGTASTQTDSVDLTRSFLRALTSIVNHASPAKPTGGINLRVFSNSEATGRTSPTPARNVLLGLIAGAIIGVALALLLGATRPRLRDPHELAQAVGAPLLGVVGTSGVGAGAAAEQLYSQQAEGTFLLTGPVENEDLTSIAQRFSVTAAGAAERTAFVEAASLTGYEPMTVQEQNHATGGLRVIHAAASKKERAEDLTSAVTVQLAAAYMGGATSAKSVPDSRQPTQVAQASADELPAGVRAARQEEVRQRLAWLSTKFDNVLRAPVNSSAAELLDRLKVARPEELRRRLTWLSDRFDRVLIAGNGLDRELIQLVREVDGVVVVAPIGTPVRQLTTARVALTDLNRQVNGVVVLDRRR